MKHEAVRARLGDHLEGDLDLTARAGIDAHLAECAECAGELAELRATVALLRGLPDPEPPAGLTDRVLARVAADATRSPGRLPRLRRIATSGTAAALAAGLAALMLVLSDSSPRTTPGELLVTQRSDASRAADREPYARDALEGVRWARAHRPGPPSWTPSTLVRDREDRIRTLVSTVAIEPSVPNLAEIPPPAPPAVPTFYGRAILGSDFPEVRPAAFPRTR